MISIERAKCPTTLTNQGSKAKNRYSHKEVVETLHKMQHGKCCYCEATISIEGHGKAVDHYHPKAIYKRKRNQWKNLLLCCAQCNGKKGDLFPIILQDNDTVFTVLFVKDPTSGEALVIDPTGNDDPEDHLGFWIDDTKPKIHGLIFAKNGSQKGKTTISVVGLDRSYYTEQHFDYLLELQLKYTSLLTAKKRKIQSEVELYESQLRMAVSAKSKYAALARAFVQKKEMKKNGLNVPIPKGSS